MSRPEDTRYGRCQATAKSTGEQCGRAAVGQHGKCDVHGGKTPTKDENEDVGAPEGNQNALDNVGGDGAEPTHGAYMDELKFYDEHISASLKQLVNDIFADYYVQFAELHGEPHTGEELELFRLANSHVKDIVLDNWSSDRPDSLAESGNPMVDRETNVSENGTEYYQYKESVVIAAQQKLSRDRLRWIKAYGLDRRDSVDADNLTNLASAMMQTLQNEYDSNDEVTV